MDPLLEVICPRCRRGNNSAGLRGGVWGGDPDGDKEVHAFVCGCGLRYEAIRLCRWTEVRWKEQAMTIRANRHVHVLTPDFIGEDATERRFAMLEVD